MKMNTRKLMALAVAVVLCCGVLCSCARLSAGPNAQLLTSGRWETETGWTYFEFYENGRYYYSVSWKGTLMHTEEGDWSISGDIVTKDPDDSDLATVKFEIDAENETLTDVDDPDEVFYLK